MISNIAILTLALAYLVLSGLEIWAVKRDRLDWAVRILTVALVAVIVLTAINIADRTWWLAALWGLNAALTIRSLRSVQRLRAEDEADEFYTA